MRSSRERPDDVALDPRWRRSAAAGRRDDRLVGCGVAAEVQIGCPRRGAATPERRRWTYAELLARRRALRPTPSAALRAGRARRGVGAQPARVGAAGVRRGARRVDPRDGQPEPAAPTEAAYVLGQSRAAGLFLLPRSGQPAGGAHAGTIRAELPSAPRSRASSARRADRRHRGREVMLLTVDADDPAQINSHERHDPGAPKGEVLRRAASSTMPGCGPTGSRFPTAPDGSSRCLCSHRWVRGGRARGAGQAGDAGADADVRARPVPQPGRAGAAEVRQHRPDDAHRRDGPSGRVAP